ncbi:hypothetical protein SAMN05192583_0044 [Sphingomonas gellani]|uniref:Transmembrane protein (PGPGW) n=1 Tax=Sphingomonas gellani TaxID=1166340 RepID=A0A1H7Y3D6_9SPHN|nr:hypothetical protein [Sphingomonas gellani]SEM39847.1 hypothetical protein SAMN05192583_0044 [Sphingomonas gellani]
MAVPRPPHPAKRIAMLSLGIVLIVVSPVLGALPGPGGIFVFAGGLILVLRSSRWARTRWVRIKRRWPRMGHLVDRAMRRGSTQRRLARAREEASGELT